MSLSYDGKNYPLCVPVPRIIACCPECGGNLFVVVNEWESDTGVPTEFGVDVDCERDDIGDPDAENPHRWWQGEWESTLESVRAWAIRWVRMAK